MWQLRAGITLLLYNLRCVFAAVDLPNVLIKEAGEVQESTGSLASKLRLDDTNDFPVRVVPVLQLWAPGTAGYDIMWELRSCSAFILNRSMHFEKICVCCNYLTIILLPYQKWLWILYFVILSLWNSVSPLLCCSAEPLLIFRLVFRHNQWIGLS